MLDGPFRGAEAIARGTVTPGRLRGPAFDQVFRGIYVPAGTKVDLVVRSRAAALLHGGRGALAGYSAAALLGAGCHPANAPAEIVDPWGTVRARPGLLVRRGRLAADDVCTVAGCRVTGPVRTAWDLARRLELVEAVVAVDALARCAGFALRALLDHRTAHPGARGCRRLDRVVALADPRAESAMETRLRLLLILGGLPVPESQYRIVDERGLVLARADLAYPDAKLAIEYDGEFHFRRDRSGRDNRRDDALAQIGWETVRCIDEDVLAYPSHTLTRITRLLAARGGSTRTALR
ncbi:endonuclease domain-containing protein [Pseudonocardia acidicola]|uniref:DUF559 domain-containing protein n=1 Tax=Pseudonocardia acidicola TaxID=2724939 RepID=A0ABX1SDV3_9PSEU|nr:DUF559 domain-containing protein [Pseudonocardia acidicola]NMH99761.1 DUF559 domain-containing protein [Pseudonocardia acidicola]